MSSLLPPAAFAIFAWWLGTALVLLVDGLRWRWTFACATAAALAALVAAAWVASSESSVSAYVGFACALVLWGWHELSFLGGIITGPRKGECPPGVRGWARFRCATETVIHHELALAATLLLLAALSYRAPNRVALSSFLVLWAMRLSAKLNLFLGVRNVASELMPERSRYLATYFRQAHASPALAISIAVSAAVAVRLGWQAAASGGFALLSATLVTSLLSLGVLEHLFLALPIPDALLWRWAARRAEARKALKEAP